MKKSFLILLPVLLLAGWKSADKEVSLQYGQMLRDAYDEKGSGRIIPVAIERAVEVDGSMTDDGQYMAYSSDREKGNFDIYLRSLTGIETVRLTSSAARDLSPALSPNGERIAFVSYREDPAGDIYTAEIDPASIVEKNKENYLDEEAVSITSVTDGNGVRRMIKDSDPVWSPDSSTIAFSSTRDGKENIYLADADGKKITRLTQEGGIYPSFSRDGKKIVYVSYGPDTRNGDIFIIDIATGVRTRVTEDDGIELYPVFCGNDNLISYTLINRDTDGDGKITLKDSSSLYLLNRERGFSYPMTDSKISAFKGRWFPSFRLTYFNNPLVNYSGVILFSEQKGDDINIEMIPEYGSVPKRKTASDQLAFARNYYNENGRDQYYLQLLQKVYFYYRKDDKDGDISVLRALTKAAYESSALGLDNRSIIKTLSSFGSRRTYAELLSEMIKSGVKAVSGRFSEAGELTPYLIDDAADFSLSRGDTVTAITLYNRILSEYPSYPSVQDVALKEYLCSDNRIKPELSEKVLRVLSFGDTLQQERMINKIISEYDAIKDRDAAAKISEESISFYEAKAESLKGRERNGLKLLLSMLHYVRGKAQFDSGRLAAANDQLQLSLKDVKSTLGIYYKANRLLADMNRENADVEERYLYECASNYLTRWHETSVLDTVSRLITYYENTGRELERKGENKKAAALYQKYYRLLSYLYQRRQFDDLYNQNAPRAHVLYVDAAVAANGSSLDAVDKIEKEYRKNLSVARMDFDKVYIYGLSYLLSMKAQMEEAAASALKGSTFRYVESFNESLEQIDWALFMDDTFVDPYLLKGWIYQYLDQKIQAARNKGDASTEEKITDVFNPYLLERAKVFYLKAIDSNDELKFPESEGNLLLNLGNINYLLNNFSDALKNYKDAQQYKTSFASRKEEAVFLFHLSYCYWQSGQIAKARAEMESVNRIYLSMESEETKEVFPVIFKYFALYDRVEGKFSDAEKWYKTILDYSIKNRQTIDTARIYQEIAWCRQNTGDYDGAVEYLNMAWKLLKKYPDDEKKFKLSIKLFYLIGPIPVYDLGPDTAAFGGSKIFNPLNTRQKKLLNLEMLYRISRNKGDYESAVSYLLQKKKIAAQKDYAVYVETYGTTLHNLGEAYFRMGNFSEAEKSYMEAWSFGEKNGNLTLSFSSITNLCEMYATMAEQGNVSITTIDAFVKKIASYRNSYIKMSRKTFTEEYQAKADREDREITEAEREEIDAKVDADAAAVYSSIDTSMALLRVAKADLLAVQNLPAAMNLYESSRIMIERALEENSSLSAAARIKLMLNDAYCLEMTGRYERAYSLYGDIEKLTEESYLFSLKPLVYSCEAKFLSRSGVFAGISDANASAEFEKSLADVERSPQIFSRESERITVMYYSYAAYLAERGRTDASFSVIERLTSVLKIIRNYSASPSFSDPVLSKANMSVKASVDKFIAISAKIARFAAAGKAEELNALIKERETAFSEIKNAAVSAGDYYTLFVFKKPTLTAVTTPYFYFFRDGDKVRLWCRVNDKTEYRSLNESELSSYIASKGEHAYIAINSYSLSLPSSQNYSYVTGLSDVDLLGDFIDTVSPEAQYRSDITYADNLRDQRGVFATAKSLYRGDYFPIRLTVSTKNFESASYLADAALFASVPDLRMQTATGVFQIARSFKTAAGINADLLKARIESLINENNSAAASKFLSYYRRAEGTDETTAEYFRARLLEMNGLSAEAFRTFPYTAETLSSLSDEAVSFGAFVLLKNGRNAEARNFLSAFRVRMNGYADWNVYENILSGSLSAVSGKTALSLDLLNILSLRYSLLLEKPFLPIKIAANAGSRSDQLLLKLSSGKEPVASLFDQSLSAISDFLFLSAIEKEGDEEMISSVLLKISESEYPLSEDMDKQILYAKAEALASSLETRLLFCTKILNTSKDTFPNLRGKIQVIKADSEMAQGNYSAAEKTADQIIREENNGYHDRALLIKAESIMMSGKDPLPIFDGFTESSLSRENNYLLKLLRSQYKRMAVFARKGDVSGAIEDYRNEIRSAINYARTGGSPRMLFSLRNDLLNKGLDFLSSYYLSRSAFRESLYYQEMKKQIRVMAYSSEREKMSRDYLNEYSLCRFDEPQKMLSLLKQNHDLYVQAVIPSLPLDQFVEVIPQNAAVLYIVKNEDDLLVYVLDKKGIHYRRIAAGFSTLVNARDLVSGHVTRADLFTREKELIGDRDFYLITDSDCSGINFDRFFPKIVYLTSIVQAVVNSGEVYPGTKVILYSQDRADFAAVKQSGLLMGENSDSSIAVVRKNVKISKGNTLFEGINSEKLFTAKEYAVIIPSERWSPDLALAAEIAGSFGVRSMLFLSPRRNSAGVYTYLSAYLSRLKSEGDIAANERSLAELKNGRRFSDYGFTEGIRQYIAGFRK